MPRPDAPACLRSVEAEAWEGGGFLGHAYGPLVEAFESWELPIVHHAGTSAGAITAALRALGYRAERVRQLQETTPWSRFACYRPPALLRLLVRGGWHSIDFARIWIEERVEEAGFAPGLTFAGLKKRTGRSLYVAATRYLQRGAGAVEAEPFVFSADLTPEAPVAGAVLASMAVPGFWPPVQVAGWWYCDGGVAMNHPLALFDAMPREAIVGARLDSSREIQEDAGELSPSPVRPGLGAIVLANAEMLRTVANRTFVPAALWERIVRIDVGDESALDFRARPERIGRLRNAGRAALGRFTSAAG